MNILHLNTLDIGGAASGAYRLHQHMMAAGHRSEMLVLTRQRKDSDVISLVTNRFLYRVRNRLRRNLNPFAHNHAGDPDYVFRNSMYSPVSDVGSILKRVSIRPDVIIAHWISDFLTVEQLSVLSRDTGAPIVWYLLDMAPMTGGCHYAWDCGGYRRECGACPALYSQSATDHSHKTWMFKKRYMRDMNLIIVAASQELFEQASSASLFAEKRIEKILLGVNPEIFSPESREMARAHFDLPRDRTIIFFGSYLLGERRKGFSFLVDALRLLVHRHGVDRKKVLIVTAGKEGIPSSALGDLLAQRHIGFLDGDRELAMAFQAADMFVCPSIEDAGPMMINESIMCGTPVVCFDVGVARDLVHSGTTGYLAELKNSDDLARGNRSVMDLSTAQAKSMSDHCRSTGLALCSPNVQVGSFLELFNSLRTDLEIRRRKGVSEGTC